MGHSKVYYEFALKRAAELFTCSDLNLQGGYDHSVS